MIILQEKRTPLSQIIFLIVSQKISESLYLFRDYSLTVSGGSRSLPNAKKDFSNLLIKFNALCENKIFDPRKLNHLITKEIDLGK